MMSKISLDVVFLGLLAFESCHGYQLLDHFRDANRLATVWNLSTSQLYSTLKRLEYGEYIDGREESSVDAPMRTVYWITEAGRERLDQWLNMPEPSASTRAVRTEFLSRLYICRLLKYPTETILANQKRACEAHRDILCQQRDNLREGAGYLSLDLRVREMTIILDWLESADRMFTQISTS
ncbi:MAG: PadR family transcriptional regulator [Anaerolineae bacterium]